MRLVGTPAGDDSGHLLAVGRLDQLRRSRGRISKTDLLGGVTVLCLNRSSVPLGSDAWFTIAAIGLPRASLEAFCQMFCDPPEVVMLQLDIKPLWPQLAEGENDRLDPTASAGVINWAGLLEMAIDVMGGPGAADQWLVHPNRALDGQVPAHVARRNEGMRVVFDVLNSIRHGHFS